MSQRHCWLIDYQAYGKFNSLEEFLEAFSHSFTSASCYLNPAQPLLISLYGVNKQQKAITKILEHFLAFSVHLWKHRALRCLPWQIQLWSVHQNQFETFHSQNQFQYHYDIAGALASLSSKDTEYPTSSNALCQNNEHFSFSFFVSFPASSLQLIRVCWHHCECTSRWVGGRVPPGFSGKPLFFDGTKWRS